MSASKGSLTTRLLDTDVGAALELQTAELVVERGHDQGVRQPLGFDSVTIGTHGSCDLLLRDPAVSGRHGRVELTREGYTYSDLESRNGTFIEGLRVHKVALQDRLRLLLGETLLRVVAKPKSEQIPLGAAQDLGQLCARSLKMRALVPLIERYARTELSLLIMGETGTGKELVSQIVHERSPRRDGPFVCVDCGAIPHELIASELYGHERGAFSGADRTRRGLFEQARGGTLFLDEIGELPLALQPALLGAIDRRRIRRVGGAEEISVDVRIISATNRNLQASAARGTFREDLYYRLGGAVLRLPPLRERPEDIRHLAQRFAEEAGIDLAPELMRALLSYGWPGNVRELQNTIGRLAATGRPLQPGAAAQRTRAIPLELFAGGVLISLKDARTLAAHQLERIYLEEALSFCEGNLSRAARFAGISRSLLMRLAKKHRLRHKDRAPEEPEG